MGESRAQVSRLQPNCNRSSEDPKYPSRPYIGQPPPPSMSAFAIDIRNVAKRYAEHVAIRALSLQVPRGAVYGLLGPNGAGKTTTIRMVLNIIAPDSGTISLFGQPHLGNGATDRIAYLPGGRGLSK